MFFALLALLCVIVALIFLPLFTDEDNRGLWVERICSCRWIPYVLPQTLSSSRTARQAVSRETIATEDAIRAAFVQEKLKDYTKIVSGQDLLTASRHRSFIVTTSNADSGRSAGNASFSAKENDNVEKGSNDNKEISSASNASKPDNTTKDATADDHTTTPKQSFTTPTCVFDTSRHGTIFLPPAGHDCHTSTTGCMRQQSGTCAICLSAFVPNDCITWSNNAACPHVFHAACIQDWLVAVGRKHVARAFVRGDLEENVDESVLTNFPMLCPCCRRPFILVDSAMEASATSSEMTHSEQGERDASSSEMSSNDSSHDGGEVAIPTAAAADDDDNTQLPCSTTREDAVAKEVINQV